jgi:long-subunit acyl-CoA synthetase (AMP-forming)
VIKLVQGCFVAPEFLETVFSTCDSVSQICLHADPLQSFVIAIVVSKKGVLSDAVVMADLLQKARSGNLLDLSVRASLYW